jgi:hypothetical protein
VTSTNAARRHHYLPQFYLNRFSNGSGQVLRTFRGPDDALHEKFFVPKATGFEDDLYTLTDWARPSPKLRPDAIETDVFGPIDHHGALVVGRLDEVAPSELSSEERAHLALFVNSLVERYPRRILEGDRKAAQAARELRDELRERWGPPPDGRPDVLELLDVEALARNLHREHIVRTIRDKRTLDYIGGLTFVKLRLEPSPALWFVTGDSPVLVNLGQPGPIHFFTLALDPNTLLFGHNDRQELLPSAETLMNLCQLHNLSLFAQCQYVFTKQPLENSEIFRTRWQASMQLIQVPWRRS